MANVDTIQLRIVAFHKDGFWVAQCLEHDISARASDLESLVMNMHDTIEAEAEYTREKHGASFRGIEPAPSYFEAMWDSSGVSICPPEIASAELAKMSQFRIAA